MIDGEKINSICFDWLPSHFGRASEQGRVRQNYAGSQHQSQPATNQPLSVILRQPQSVVRQAAWFADLELLRDIRRPSGGVRGLLVS